MASLSTIASVGGATTAEAAAGARHVARRTFLALTSVPRRCDFSRADTLTKSYLCFPLQSRRLWSTTEVASLLQKGRLPCSLSPLLPSTSSSPSSCLEGSPSPSSTLPPARTFYTASKKLFKPGSGASAGSILGSLSTPFTGKERMRFTADSVGVGGDGGDSGGGEGNGSGGEGGGSSGGGGRDGGGEEPSSSGSSLLGSLASAYMQSLEKRPLVTKGLTAGLLNAVADIVCQVFVDHAEALDFKRVASFAAIGALLVGPVLHIWYGLLGSVIKVTGTPGLLLRLFIDQVVFSPVSIATFVALVMLLEGRPQDIQPKLRQDLVPTVLNMWKLWVPFQLLNFAVIPPQLQVGAVNIIGMVWTVYMSYVSHTDTPPQEVAVGGSATA